MKRGAITSGKRKAGGSGRTSDKRKEARKKRGTPKIQKCQKRGKREETTHKGRETVIKREKDRRKNEKE